MRVELDIRELRRPVAAKKPAPTPAPARAANSSIRVSELLSALSYALDLTEGRPMGHSVRSCIIGMRIPQQIGLPEDAQADLYYTLLMKDAGCSSNCTGGVHLKLGRRANGQ